MSTSTSVIVRQLPPPQNDGAASIVKFAEKFAPAIPRFMDKDQFIHALVTAANELSKPCSPRSVMVSAINCCKVGLMPGAALGLAYFVPFKGQCQLIVGYRGFIDLVHRNKFVRDIYTNVILHGEEAREWADENGVRFKHEVPLDRDLDPKQVTHAYCIANLSNSGKQVKIVNRQQIDASYRDTPAWNDRLGFMEMAQKTAIRRAAKQWKLTPDMALALHLDEQAELGKSQGEMVDLGEMPETTRPAVRSLKELDDAPDDGGDLSPDEKAAIIEQERVEAAQGEMY